MSTLSKTTIEGIAKRMTEKSRKYRDQLKKEYQTIATEIYEASIPEEVKKCFKKYPDYIETCGSLWVNEHGFSGESITMVKRLPATTNYNQELSLTKATADKLIAAKRKFQKAEEEYKQLFSETEVALFALKTPKNIRENLPEAIPFLPPPMSNALVVNFEGLKRKLNKQPETKSELTVS